MTNSADPDQLASSEANRSGSTLFAKAGYILVQQDQGLYVKFSADTMQIYVHFNLWSVYTGIQYNLITEL